MNSKTKYGIEQSKVYARNIPYNIPYDIIYILSIPKEGDRI